MALTPDQVRKVASLARLELGDDEIESLRTQLDSILGHIEQLQSLDLEKVEPMSHPINATNRLDDDKPGTMLTPEQLMHIAPETFEGHIKVPKVLGDSSA